MGAFIGFKLGSGLDLDSMKMDGSGSQKNILLPREGKQLYELTRCIWIWTLL